MFVSSQGSNSENGKRDFRDTLKKLVVGQYEGSVFGILKVITASNGLGHSVICRWPLSSLFNLN